MIRNEINILFTAIMFYSRIPVPKNIGFSNEMLNSATRYFPFVGLIVGAIGAFVFWGLQFVLPTSVAIVLSMIVTIFVTGAFHEDGFSDFCDGFGGGYTKERILEIMKDSCIGTYGAVGLLLMLLTKFLCLSNMLVVEIPVVLIAAHAFSRLLPVGMIYTSSYVREDLLSKSKPIGHKGSMVSFVVAFVFAIAALYFVPFQAIGIIIGLSFVLFLLFKRYVESKLNGYTGDILGALQQLAEITFYLGFLIYKNTFA